MLPAALRTARLMLRPVMASDQASIISTLNLFEVTRWLRTVPFPYSAKDFDLFCNEIAVVGGDYVIEDDGGFCGLVGIDDGREIGYWLAPHAQGKGYATEASEAVLAAAFRATDSPVQSGYFVGNARSARVLQKLGFVETARSMERCEAQGVKLPHVTLTLDKTSFLVAQEKRQTAYAAGSEVVDCHKGGRLPATLQTTRLVLRPPGAEDADWIAREIARPEVHQMLTTPPRPYRLADAQAWLNMISGRDGVCVIVADGPLGIVDLGRGEGERELGYWLRTDAWGKGYMTEAAQALVAAWFDTTDGDLVSGHLTANAASAGVLRKLGFAYEAPVMRYSGFWGREVEVLRMRLTKMRWLEHARDGGPAS